MELRHASADPLLPTVPDRGRAVALAWLGVTITLETAGTLLLKRNESPARAAAFVCYFTSLALFSHVLRVLPLSVAYSTWCTCGTVGVAVLSSLVYDETLRPAQYLCIAASVPCVVGLHVL